MYMMESFIWICKMLLSIVVFRTDVHCFNVSLTLEPAVVERNHSCTLRCTYDLEGMPLYTVKWYRGIKEFYRYTPYEKPPTKIFHTPGINVDEHQSSSTQVVLRDVDFNLSGNFTCEVTTDNDFSTGHDVKAMSVVQLPQHPPQISVGSDPLDYGDTLSASCMSPSSKPLAKLKFVLNNRTVARSDPYFIRQHSHQPSWSDLSLNITLSEDHFTAGRLILGCDAKIGDIYHTYVELKLNTARDPVPERVSAESTAYLVSSTAAIHLVIISWLVVFVN